MFNHIRKVPYAGGDGKGGLSYFAGGFSNQFGMETQIIAAMCEFKPLDNHDLNDTNREARWDPVVRHHSSCAQSTSDGGS